ncbi:MAG TPA: tRNA (adenosine(37)-N6)-threonylcarbamoyltransferase complex transferase subunit TsaD, partial [Gemmatimonadota bacterium]|nr:tRNA (adenosine(37)-N6)-threonylcarbamoyltransferase complex transferase subunit TsaD [Gemmatimonadota bacterium]
ILAGGVACNGALREAMRARLEGALVVWPAPVLCTDNGAMIARTAVLRQDEGVQPGAFDIHASLPLP